MCMPQRGMQENVEFVEWERPIQTLVDDLHNGAAARPSMPAAAAVIPPDASDADPVDWQKLTGMQFVHPCSEAHLSHLLAQIAQFPGQQAAVQRAVGGQHPYVGITGPAGVGKSKVLQAIVYSLAAAGRRVLVCASTAKAAGQLGLPAYTFHKALGIHGSNVRYTHPHPKILAMLRQTDALVVDEFSMSSLEALQLGSLHCQAACDASDAGEAAQACTCYGACCGHCPHLLHACFDGRLRASMFLPGGNRNVPACLLQCRCTQPGLWRQACCAIGGLLPAAGSVHSGRVQAAHVLPPTLQLGRVAALPLC